jgi:hypothetical protein
MVKKPSTIDIPDTSIERHRTENKILLESSKRNFLDQFEVINSLKQENIT